MRSMLWLTTLKIFHVSDGMPEGASDKDERKFQEANTIFVGCVLSVLVDRLCDVYMHMQDGKTMWDALNAKFSAKDACIDLYTSWRIFTTTRW